VNVIGNSVATIVVAKWEKAFDGERAAQVLSGLTPPAEENGLAQ
jgi:Na+/H+-dicarboxylate symporter